MAQLPKREAAFIEPTKIRDYVLSSTHPVGRFKASFFRKMGYTPDNWERLAHDIKQQHLPLDAKPTEKNAYGQKYVITGRMKGPNGMQAIITTVWIILHGAQIPRFITMYPGEKTNDKV